MGKAKDTARKLRAKLAGASSTLLIVGAVLAAMSVAPRCLPGTDIALDAVNACPAATEALGPPVDFALVGITCGMSESEGSFGHTEWLLPVAGSEARGSLHFTAERPGDGSDWQLIRAVVTVGDQEISVVPCQRRTQPDGGK